MMAMDDDGFQLWWWRESPNDIEDYAIVDEEENKAMDRRAGAGPVLRYRVPGLS